MDQELNNVKQEMISAIHALTDTAHRLRASSIAYVNTKCDYEELKNAYELEMKDAEFLGQQKKRTIPERQAEYRLQFKNERRAAMDAETAYKTDSLLFKGLQAKLNALQSQLRLIETELKQGLTVEDQLNSLHSRITLLQEQFGLDI